MPQREFKVDGLQELNPKGFGGMVSRAVTIGKKEIDFEKGIDTIATTDAPALVVDWERWQVVREILPMRYCEMPANDKVPLLDSHSRFEIEQVKGSAKNFTIEGGQLLCKSFVSESEQAVRQKIKEGHIDSVSIGYKTDPSYTVEVPKGANVTIDGVAYKNEFDDGYPFVVRTWWKTHELSLVAIGADEAAKFKSLTNTDNKKFFEKIEEQNQAIKNLMAEVEKLKNPEVEGDQLLRAAATRDIKRELVMRLRIIEHELKLK